MSEKGTDRKGGVEGRDGVPCGGEYLDEKEVGRTLVLLVEGAVATPPAEGVGLGVPLTARMIGGERIANGARAKETYPNEVVPIHRYPIYSDQSQRTSKCPNSTRTNLWSTK